MDVGLGSVQIPLEGRDDCAKIRVVDSGKNIILEINSESDSTINYGLY